MEKISQENEHSEQHCLAFMMMNWTHPSIHNTKVIQLPDSRGHTSFHTNFLD